MIYRQFLDNVVTSVLVFEDKGQVQEYLGGYSDWENNGKELKITDHQSSKELKRNTLNITSGENSKKVSPAKLSYKLQRELDMLPEIIKKMEEDIVQLQAEAAKPEFYLKPFTETQPLLDTLEEKQKALDVASERWLELEISG